MGGNLYRCLLMALLRLDIINAYTGRTRIVNRASGIDCILVSRDLYQKLINTKELSMSFLIILFDNSSQLICTGIYRDVHVTQIVPSDCSQLW